MTFWDQAARCGLPWFRFLRCSIVLEEVDRELCGTLLESDWLKLKAQMKPGDELWPFEFRVRRYLGMRKGYLVLRGGRAVGGVVTVVS